MIFHCAPGGTPDLDFVVRTAFFSLVRTTDPWSFQRPRTEFGLEQFQRDLVGVEAPLRRTGAGVSDHLVTFGVGQFLIRPWRLRLLGLWCRLRGCGRRCRLISPTTRP